MVVAAQAGAGLVGPPALSWLFIRDKWSVVKNTQPRNYLYRDTFINNNIFFSYTNTDMT